MIKALINAIENENDVSTLHTILKISPGILINASRITTPPLPEYLEAANALLKLEQELQTAETYHFNELKSRMLSIILTIKHDQSQGDKMCGSGTTNLWNELKMAFLIVEQRNNEFFKTISSRLSPGEHDRLHNHYSLYQSGNEITLAWIYPNSLPEEIKEQVMHAFNNVCNRF